ncbi:MAG: thiol protease/hemagglutinin PrtT [Bacteroidetes bacterium]|nr:thiol protease/hemagglutinin PrtT [Bacteroidota bacterium]
MKTKLNIAALMISLHILSAFNISASPVDTVISKVVAKNYFEYLKPEKSPVSFTNIITGYYNNYPVYYIFNTGNDGYIIVSANDAVEPILGYSFNNPFDSSTVNSGLKLFLEEYGLLVDSARAYNLTNIEALQQWEEIYNRNLDYNRSVNSNDGLIKTRWGQDHANDSYYACPAYNYYTPTHGFCSECENHCAAGCVAIAMAQVMKFWEYPVHPTYMDYDWCNMPPELNSYNLNFEIERNAIATLVHDCGVNADMTYCIGGELGDCESFAWPVNARDALVDDFGYSSDADLKRRQYHLLQWENMLKDEINNNRPVIYFALKGLNGHSFIIDAYDGDKFHINWGWYEDVGWFKISEIEFTIKHRAIFNLHPYWYLDCNIVRYVCTTNTNNNPVGGTIIAGGYGCDVVIQSGVTAVYQAYNEIILKENFTAEAGSDFTATIIPCPDCPEINNLKIAHHENSNEYTTNANTSGHVSDIKESANLNTSFGYSIFPNPTSDYIIIKSDISPFDKSYSIDICNIYGETIVSQKCKFISKIDMSSFSKGIYIVKIYSESKIISKKIILE